MLAIPDYVSLQCPRCTDDIHFDVDVTSAPAARGTRLMVQVADQAGLQEVADDAADKLRAAIAALAQTADAT